MPWRDECPHGFKLLLEERDGWQVPMAPPECGVCEGQVGIKFKEVG